MVALIARYHVKPGHADEVVAALRRMQPLVAAHEPGCTQYIAHRDGDLVVLYEQYADEAALEAHRETPYFQDIIEGTIVPLLERREREILPVLTL
jgi:(4S)-4-hydroxy-5-phosphonooxypentane-2,3-dione isomerase